MGNVNDTPMGRILIFLVISIEVVLYQFVPVFTILITIEVSVERDEFSKLKGVVAGGKGKVSDVMVESFFDTSKVISIVVIGDILVV